MKATMRWFVSPRFADAEQTRVAHLLNILLLSSLLFLCVVFIIRLALLGLVGHWFVYPLFIALSAGLIVTLRRGYVYTSGVIFGAMLLAYGFFGALTTGGLGSPTVQVFMLVILVGAMLGSTRWVVGATTLCLISTSSLAAIQLRGALPEVAFALTTGSILSGQLLATLMIGGAAALIIASLQEARQRAVAKERALAASLDALKEAQAELVAHRDALEKRVVERTAGLEATIVELERTQDQLIQSEKMASLGLLVSGIAHELKNPLNFVNNFSELAAEFIDELLESRTAGEPVDAAEFEATLSDVADNLKRVRDHGRRADDIINAMLMHTRERHGEPSIVDFNAMLVKHASLACHGFRASEGSFAVVLVKDLDPSIGETMLPYQELARVIVNLVSNACHAMRERQRSDPKHKASLTLRTIRHADAIELVVKDNGTGMTPDIRRRVFEPFYTTKPPGEGTGLGLSLSYEVVVKGLGGSIDVLSTAGEGSEFVVRFPAPDKTATVA